MKKDQSLIPVERIERLILLIRGKKVLLDFDLAEMYGVETKVLNQAVKRNLKRFPSDFMFQLTSEELNTLRSQFVTSKGFGGRRVPPYVFTEQGVAMISGVLNSSRAIEVNIAIMRTFVSLRKMLSSNEELSRRLHELETKYDKQFRIVFEAIRELMTPPEPKRNQMGFQIEDKNS